MNSESAMFVPAMLVPANNLFSPIDVPLLNDASGMVYTTVSWKVCKSHTLER